VGFFSDIENHLIPSVVRSTELIRVESMPRRPLTMDPELTRIMTGMFRKEGGTAVLRDIQAVALKEAAQAGGLFGMIGVGWGKTLITLLMPTAMDSEVALLLLPSQLKKKTLMEIENFYGKHFDLPALHIRTYEELSSAKTADMLNEINPDLIILDEAHKLSRPQSARTKRFMRFMESSSCRLVALSGTMGNRSIREYAHLCELALGTNSPLPRGYMELVDWAGALDVSPMEPRRPGALKGLCEPGETVRSGFRRRMADTLGVIAAEGEGFGGALILKEFKTKLPKTIKGFRKRVEETWEIGEEIITEVLQYARVMRQLSLGFYYEWEWENGRDEEWLEARKSWRGELRRILRYNSRPGMDSELLVKQAVEAGDIGGTAQEAYQKWLEVADRPEPNTKVVWVDNFILDSIKKWIKKEKKGIIWFEHSLAFVPAFKELGIPTYGSGDDASSATSDVIACSIRAQGTGKNLQRYSKNLILAMPSNGGAVEQLIGRTHRPGQQNEEVVVWWNASTPEMVRAMESAEEDAKFAKQAHGQEQKLLIADYVGA